MMTKKTYIPPLTDIFDSHSDELMKEGSWGFDGSHKPIIEGDPEEIFAKEYEVFDLNGSSGNDPWDADPWAINYDLWSEGD